MTELSDGRLTHVWQQVGQLILATGEDHFAPLFSDTCRSAFGNDQCNIFVFEAGLEGGPRVLFSDVLDDQMRSLTRDMSIEYITSGYRSDPILAAAQREGGAALMTHRISRQSIDDARYRRRYYDHAQVRQKLAMLCSNAQCAIYLNLYRNPDQPDYTDAERAQFDLIGAALSGLLHKHLRLAPRAPDPSEMRSELSAASRERVLERLRQTLLAEYSELTPREAQVCASVAIGLTTEGIGLTLGISVNTVATHRKRAYAKLGISSQNELFMRHHSAIASHINMLRMN